MPCDFHTSLFLLFNFYKLWYATLEGKICKWFHYRVFNFPGSYDPVRVRHSDAFLPLPFTGSLRGNSHRNIPCTAVAVKAFSSFPACRWILSLIQNIFFPQTLFRQVGFLIGFPSHQISGETRVTSGIIANTFDQQALLPVAIWQKCHRAVSLPHHKIWMFSFFSMQCNTDLPHYCSSYNHSCHNQTYYKIIRLIRVTLQ